MRVLYFRIQPEVIIERLSGPRAMPRLEVLMDQCICVSEDDGNGVPVWSVVIPDNWETKARTYVNKFLGIGLREIWDDHQDIARHILRKRVQLAAPDEEGNPVIVEMYMSDTAPAGSTVVETTIHPHTFFGYDPSTGLPE